MTSSRSVPASMTRIGGIRRPSSQMLCVSRPEPSAWWAMLATKPMRTLSANTGEATVMSGRWVLPPV